MVSFRDLHSGVEKAGHDGRIVGRHGEEIINENGKSMFAFLEG